MVVPAGMASNDSMARWECSLPNAVDGRLLRRIGPLVSAGVARTTVCDVAPGRSAAIRRDRVAASEARRTGLRRGPPLPSHGRRLASPGGDTRVRLLAVTAVDVGGNALVEAAPALGLRAQLYSVGYSPSWIAEELQLGSSAQWR